MVIQYEVSHIVIRQVLALVINTNELIAQDTFLSPIFQLSCKQMFRQLSTTIDTFRF